MLATVSLFLNSMITPNRHSLDIIAFEKNKKRKTKNKQKRFSYFYFFVFYTTWLLGDLYYIFWRLFPINQHMQTHFEKIKNVIIGLLYGRWWWCRGSCSIIGPRFSCCKDRDLWHSSIIVVTSESSGDLSMSWEMIRNSKTKFSSRFFFKTFNCTYKYQPEGLEVSRKKIVNVGKCSLKPISRLFRLFFFFIISQWLFDCLVSRPFFLI